MTEKKQKRYPTDRLKLHALLEKKQKELVDLREEVEEIPSRDSGRVHQPGPAEDPGTGAACW